jgi:hypothetical protein
MRTPFRSPIRLARNVYFWGPYFRCYAGQTGISRLKFHVRATQHGISYHDNMRYISDVPHVAAIDQVDLNNGTINTFTPC